MFGLSAALPAACRLARHRHLAATPASMQASDPRRPACWRVWRPSGGGGPGGRQRARRRTGRTWCGPVEVVWSKFARYWDIEIREVPMSPGSYAMDPASMLERVDENTIMVCLLYTSDAADDLTRV